MMVVAVTAKKDAFSKFFGTINESSIQSNLAQTHILQTETMQDSKKEEASSHPTPPQSIGWLS